MVEVLCIHVMAHVDDDQAALRNVRETPVLSRIAVLEEPAPAGAPPA